MPLSGYPCCPSLQKVLKDYSNSIDMSAAGVLYEIEDDILFSGRTGILHGDEEYIKRGASSAEYYLVGWSKESPPSAKNEKEFCEKYYSPGLNGLMLIQPHSEDLIQVPF